MNGLIKELTTELKNNTSINSSLAARVVLDSINNSLLLGVPAGQILENSLTTLDQFATELVNENLKEVVANFKKLASKPTKSLENMAKEAGLSIKINSIKESELYADPVVKHTIARLEEAVSSMPEFRAIGFVYDGLSKFAYDKTVSNVLESIVSYVDANRAKLEIMNSIFEMRMIGPVVYRGACDVLESALLDDITTADSLKMKLRTYNNLPIVSRLINTISMYEAKETGKFNIGIGNGDAQVKPIIAPFYKVSESDALIYVDNKFIRISEDADPSQITPKTASEFPEFFAVCESFAALGFTQNGSDLIANCRNLSIAFGVNENGTLNLKINSKIVEDLSAVKLTEIFLMETVEIRSYLSKIFDNLDLIVNVEFGRTIINERLGRDSIVLNLGEDIFVFEKLGQTRLVKKMKGLTFHNYVMENFKYDVSELYSIQLEEKDSKIKALDSEKAIIESNLEKLEKSIAQIKEALKDSTISVEYQEKLNELKLSIEKNVNALKSQYILIDQSKKKA
jgi:hypothetical protein